MDQVNILSPESFGGMLTWVLSWDFPANQNKAIYIQRLANLNYITRWDGSNNVKVEAIEDAPPKKPILRPLNISLSENSLPATPGEPVPY